MNAVLYCNDHANLVLINSDDFDYRKHMISFQGK